MYKLILSWRYLRTRYIALASIISVTLGVATLIVVNSVMEGFSAEMHKRMHGILSDIVVESAGLEGIYDPQWHMEVIRSIIGDDLAGMTPSVRVPAMLNFQYRGKWVTQQVMLIGVDETTYADVSDFSQYVLHPGNRQNLRFLLHEDGYEKEGMPAAGWQYRRGRVAFERQYTQQINPLPPNVYDAASAPSRLPMPQPSTEALTTGDPAHRIEPAEDPFAKAVPADPFAAGRTTDVRPFDEMHEQYTGAIIGIAIASTRFRDPQGKVQDYFLIRPGDDVQITLPTSGTPPQAVSNTFTVVDLYESKMSEYDSSFAFVPLSKLQDLRGMVDPLSGVASVTSIQVKLKKGADLNAIRDKLRQRFPAEQYAYRIQTWRDMQGPLLAAVSLETTILNILLFLIIAVAGFGILATFFMIVVEKTRDIGILKALGAPSGGVMSIFLSYGLSLGIVGSGVGAVLGLLFVVYINDIAKIVERITGREVFDPTVYYFQRIPTIIDPLTVTWVTVGAVLIAVLASVLPALRAARLHPVEALRYE
jgi:lipoprotein-releasing system permease protein